MPNASLKTKTTKKTKKTTTTKTKPNLNNLSKNPIVIFYVSGHFQNPQSQFFSNWLQKHNINKTLAKKILKKI